jgi:hypothetical protein
MLDGDSVQSGQMLSSESVLEYLLEAVAQSNKQLLQRVDTEVIDENGLEL